MLIEIESNNAHTAISKQIRETPIPWKQQDISIPLSLFQSDEGREVEKDQEELQESVYELIKKLVSQFRARINSEVSRREQQANEFSTTFRPVVARVSSDQFELVTLCRVLDHLPDKTFKILIAEMSSGKIKRSGEVVNGAQIEQALQHLSKMNRENITTNPENKIYGFMNSTKKGMSFKIISSNGLSIFSFLDFNQNLLL